MQSPSIKNTPPLSSPASLSKASPQNPKIPTSAEGMIKGLDTRFKKIYESVKELKDKKVQLAQENEQTMEAIESETQINEENLDKLSKEITKISIKNNEILRSSQDNRENKTPTLVDELNKRNKFISDLAEQTQTIMDSLKKEAARTESLEKQIQFLKKENIDIDNYLAQSPNREDIEDRNLSNFPKYQNLLKKNNSKGFGGSNNISPRQNELDKLLNISPKSGRKTKAIENLENLLRETIEVNNHLKQENEKLKKKIMSNMHSDYEKPVYAVGQNTDREAVEHAKKQQKLKISKLFADEDKLISHISHHSRDGVITHTEEEYIKKKDAQNEENFRRILEIKELERLRETIIQQEAYINELDRNVVDREQILYDQKREMTSLEDNLKNLEFDIQKNVLEKETVETKIREKALSLEELRGKYKDAIRVLPEDLRPREQTPKDNFRGYTSNIKPTVAEDEDLEKLLKVTPKALDIRKN